MCRNRYVYGKLLDVFHFELEQNYFNAKRFLVNRMILGYGVVCGLGVEPAPDRKSIVVRPGFAIDKWGREILVPESTRLLLPTKRASPTDSARAEPCDDDNWTHLCLCYHECLSDPEPVLGAGCDEGDACTPGTICERFEIGFRDGKLPDIDPDCSIPDLVSGGRLNYPAFVNYVSGKCLDCADDPCIPLANIRYPDEGKPFGADYINIAIRPIVYTNDLLYELITCLGARSRQPEWRGKN
jgi:hypothetical protein